MQAGPSIPDLEPSVWAAWVGAAASWAAALVALAFGASSARTAKQAFRMAEEQYLQSHPHLELYLANNLIYRPPGEAFRIVAFSLLVRNPSSSPNSISRLDLEIVYSSSKGVLITVQLSHDPSLSSFLVSDDLTAMEVPTHIEAHGTCAGWALFRIDDALAGDTDINEYRVAIRDGHDLKKSIEAVLLREVVSEQEIEEKQGSTDKDTEV